MKIIPLFILLLLQTCISFAQNNLSALLSDKKWGLSRFREMRGLEEDTLFTVKNCEKEYLWLSSDGLYEYATGVKIRHGKWKLTADSLLYLYKKNEKIFVALKIMKVDAENLLVSETQRLNIFVHEYALCKEGDTAVFDSRPEFIEKKIHAFALGSQFSMTSNMLELGYTRAKIAWNEQVYLFQALAEVNFWNSNLKRTKMVYRPDSLGPDYEIQVPRENIYGLHLNFMTQRWFAGGAGISMNTNGKKFQFGVRPIIGFSFKFLGDIGALSSLVYSYNFLLLKEGFGIPIEDLNRSSVTLRIGIPVKKHFRKVNKLVFLDE
jgi:hypothetical protein